MRIVSVVRRSGKHGGAGFNETRVPMGIGSEGGFMLNCIRGCI